jgi:hypothetical protein
MGVTVHLTDQEAWALVRFLGDIQTCEQSKKLTEGLQSLLWHSDRSDIELSLKVREKVGALINM